MKSATLANLSAGHFSELNIAHLNVCSLRRKTREVQDLMTRRGVHMMCTSEAWLDSTIMSGELSIPHFQLHRLDRLEGRGGGVAIYSHESLLVQRSQGP